MADVEAKEPFEETGLALEEVEGEVAEAGGSVHEEHGASHEVRAALDGSVGLLVGGEVAAAEGFGQGEGLMEGEAEAFSGDGVDGAGGVADESYVAAGDSMELAVESDGAARGVGGGGGVEATLELRVVGEGALDGGDFCGGYEGYADLVGGDGGDVGLAVIAPVDFDEVWRRFDLEVLAEAYALGAVGDAIERCAGSDAGLVAVGSDDEAGLDGVAVGADYAALAGSSLLRLNFLDFLDYGLPVEMHAEGGGAIEEELMEEGSAQASTCGCGEGCLGSDWGAGAFGVEEADSVEGGAFS